MRIILLVLAALLLSAESSLSQKLSAAHDALPAASLPFVTQVDVSVQFNQRSIPDGRIDTDSGILRAAFRIQAEGPPLATPEQTARAWMAENRIRFGWTTADDLELTEEIRTSYSTHLTFQQTFHGVPVHRRRVKVNLGPSGLPTMVLSGYAPHLAEIDAFDATPTVSSDQAKRQAQQLVSAAGASSSEPELVVYPLATPVLVWRVIAWPVGAPGEWEVLLNAHSGATIHLLDRVIRHRHEDSTSVPRRIDGKGKAWIPDPITSAGVTYGGAYVDNNDSNSDALNDQRKEVSLLDIEHGADGKYRLKGPYVSIDGSIGTPYTPPAEDSENDFDYLRANQHFEAVQVYYHIDANQRYIQSLDIGHSIQGGGLRSNPHGEGSADNSAYYPFQNAVSFGDGGIDDGEDAEVILHEYGHAILEGSSGDLFGTLEGAGLHEGWGDYWATSYTRGLMDQGVVPAHDWQHVFSWDGNETWPGRRLGSSATYPDGFECTGNVSFCNFYADGLIWATSLMQIYDAIGKRLTDQLNLISHAYLNAPVKFSDAAEALLQADQDRYQGAHVPDIGQILSDRGYIECLPGALQLVHTPVLTVPDASTPLLVELQTDTCGDGITRHEVHYSIDDEAWKIATMAPAGEGLYTYSIELSPGAETVEYYFEVEQASGVITRLPAAAPQSVFAVDIEVDTEAPVIVHPYLTHVAMVDWPPSIEARITDAVDIDSAWVEFEVEEAGGARLPSQTFALTGSGSLFTGSFPPMDIPLKSRAYYRVWAEDAAEAENVSALPPLDMPAFVIHIIEKGILASYDPDEGAVLHSDGEWRRAKPSYGLMVPHSGEYAWLTNDADPYTDQPSTSVLEIPEIDLINFSEAFLELWHWHDFEHSGITRPTGSPAGRALDGGNVKVSTDGGANWQVLTPEKGYTASLDDANPLGGERAYAGYSYGWRRALFDLPHVPRVLLHIEAATGSGNAQSTAHGYAGWALDDVRILEERPADNAVPTVSVLPEPLVSVPAGTGAPPIEVVATDNTGIESILAEFTFEPSNAANRSGTLRLAMDPAEPNTFAGAFPVPDMLQRGDRIRYRFRVQDFDDNSVVVPAQGDAPFEIEARLVERIPALARATATGLWTKDGQGGYAATHSSSDLVSSIVLVPTDLPTNAAAITLRLDHAASFGAARGNVKVSEDDGSRWLVISPKDGYDEAYTASGSHPMAGEQVFANSRDEVTLFDLTPRAGARMWIRIDLGTDGRLTPGESWVVRSAVLESTTIDESLNLDPGLALHGNFPDPFASRTTISYSVPEPMPVYMDVHNVLGRRVMVLVDQEKEAGTHTLHLDFSGLAGGVYFLRMRTGRQTFMESLILAR